MKSSNNIDRIQTIRPRVLEIDAGLFRGYVDIQERDGSTATSRKSHYCQNVSASRDLAERQALNLAKHIGAAARHSGASAQLLCDSLSDSYAARRELDNVPAFLIRPTKTAPITRQHLRAVA